jgi:hypothetical protein
MRDIARWEALASRAKTLRRNAEALIADGIDARMRDLLRRRVLAAIDDVELHFLADSLPPVHGDEDVWRVNADLVLSGAEVQFVSLSIAIDRIRGTSQQVETRV